MNSKKLLSLYGLKWNPFTPDVPPEALLVTKKVESFSWRIESLIQDGGFALITGDPGTGKSVALRLLAERLKTVRDVVVARRLRGAGSLKGSGGLRRWASSAALRSA
jgi:type II secretory pathway predicted ATPase ExeA